MQSSLNDLLELSKFLQNAYKSLVDLHLRIRATEEAAGQPSPQSSPKSSTAIDRIFVAAHIMVGL